MRIFTGFDQREAVGWHVFAQSVIANTSAPVGIYPIGGSQRDGTNAFTYSRFLVPDYCHFLGWALWADGADMLALGDLGRLWAMRDPTKAVQVVQHDYKTSQARKYIGTDLEADNRDYPRKNWSSLILWNCNHWQNRKLTPDFVEKQDGAYLHRFGWLDDRFIGELPIEWNWLDEYGPNPEAKILHYTLGIPAIESCKSAPHAGEWFKHNNDARQAPNELNA